MRPLTLMTLALLAGCGTQPGPTASTAAPVAPTLAAPSATEGADGLTALELLECDAGPSDVGGAGEGIAEGQGGATPEETVAAFLASTPFVIPRTNYEPIGQSGDRHAYGYRVEGDIKVVLVVSTRFPDLAGTAFAADELRTCPSQEFGSDAEFGDGRRTWTHIETGRIITDIPGPSHCEWQSARMMHVPHPDGSLDRQYLRDPESVFADLPFLDTYAEAVDLPDDASDSGYRSTEGWELWFTRTDTAAYVVTPDGVERWPQAVEPIGCT